MKNNEQNLSIPISGKAAERLHYLCDFESFEEIFPQPDTVHFTALGTINSCRVIIIAVDPEPRSSPPDLAASFRRYAEALDFARNHLFPVILLFDSPALYQSGRTAFQGTQAELMMGDYCAGKIYYETGRLLGEVPILAAVFGNMAQAQAFPVALCDALVMLASASLSISRPDVVKEMIGEGTNYQELGGAAIHACLSGTCDYIAESESDALDWIRKCLGYVSNRKNTVKESVSKKSADSREPDLSSLIPAALTKPFNAENVAKVLADDGRFLEFLCQYAGEIIVGMAHIDGMTVGLAINNPSIRSGLFFPETCDKLSRFIKLCSARNIPMVFLADSPGFMIGTETEKSGLVRHGANLFREIANAHCPRICIILRRSYTAGLYAMSGSGFAPEGIYALPGAVVSVYGPEAVERFLAKNDFSEEKKDEIRRQMENDRNLNNLVDRGFLTGIIQPDEVRVTIKKFLSGHYSLTGKPS